MNQEHKDNLLLHAEWLLKNVTNLEFDMEYYTKDGDDRFVASVSKDGKVGFTEKEQVENVCGTICCSMGWSVNSMFDHNKLIHLDDTVFDGNENLRLNSYWLYDYISERLFGLFNEGPEWRWLFDEGWQGTDNSVEGAAARIRWLVHKGIPENYKEQIKGDEPLCYVKIEKTFLI